MLTELQAVMWWHIPHLTDKDTPSYWVSRMQTFATTTSTIESIPWWSREPANGSFTSTTTFKVPQLFWALECTTHLSTSIGKAVRFPLHALFHQFTRALWFFSRGCISRAGCWRCISQSQVHSTATTTSTTEHGAPSLLEALPGPCFSMASIRERRSLLGGATTPHYLRQWKVKSLRR